MICCVLMYMSPGMSADESMAKFSNARTKDFKGVTIPSQKRWVGSPLGTSTLQYRISALRLGLV
jgi:hypothetical protein